MTGWVPLALVVPIGLVAGRLARLAADRDRASRAGSAPASSPGRRRLPLIELGTTAALAAMVARFGLSSDVVPHLVIVPALVAVTVTDVRDRRVPNRIVAPAIVATGAVSAITAFAVGRPERLAWMAFGAIVFGVVLLAVHLVRPDGLGLGDVKLAVLLGAGIGWGVPPVLATVLLVAWTLLVACAAGLVQATIGRRSTGSAATQSWRAVAVPFAPALSGATVAVVLLAEPLLQWS